MLLESSRLAVLVRNWQMWLSFAFPPSAILVDPLMCVVEVAKSISASCLLCG